MDCRATLAATEMCHGERSDEMCHGERSAAIHLRGPLCEAHCVHAALVRYG